MTWLTEHRSALADMLAHVRRQPLSVVLNVLVVGITLIFPLFGFMLLENLQPLAERFASRPEISVFMALGVPRVQALALGPRLKSNPIVSAADFMPREQALASMQQQKAVAGVVAVLGGNPLPDAWVLKLRPGTNARAQEMAANELRTLSGVEQVQLDTESIFRIEALIRFLQLGLSLIGGALGAAVVAVIFNTVRLQVLTQRDEIDLSRLVGATDRFVGRPFYYLGTLQGATGAALALMAALLALLPLNRALAGLTQLYASDFRFAPIDWLHAAAFFVTAAALGWLGAVLSVRRHLAPSKNGNT